MLTAADIKHRDAFLGLGAREILFSLVCVGFINAQYIRLARQFDRDGIVNAFAATFGISIVVWVAAFAVLQLILKSKPHALSCWDTAVLAIASLLFLSPVTAMSAVALTLIAVNFAVFGKTDEIRRAMRLLIALAGAVMWGRLAFSFFLPYILQMDAGLASHLTGLERTRNLIVASDGVTVLQVGAGCSSFLNVTNAALGWLTAMLYFERRFSGRSFIWLGLSMVAIVAINTLRIGLIGWWPSYYWLIHGEIGANLTNVISSLSIYFFARRAAFP